MAAKYDSHAETSNAFPGTPPIASTSVSRSFATALRRTAGSEMKTRLPAGASTVSPPSVNVARPEMTT